MLGATLLPAFKLCWNMVQFCVQVSGKESTNNLFCRHLKQCFGGCFVVLSKNNVLKLIHSNWCPREVGPQIITFSPSQVRINFGEIEASSPCCLSDSATASCHLVQRCYVISEAEKNSLTELAVPVFARL